MTQKKQNKGGKGKDNCCSGCAQARGRNGEKSKNGLAASLLGLSVLVRKCGARVIVRLGAFVARIR